MCLCRWFTRACAIDNLVVLRRRRCRHILGTGSSTTCQVFFFYSDTMHIGCRCRLLHGLACQLTHNSICHTCRRACSDLSVWAPTAALRDLAPSVSRRCGYRPPPAPNNFGSVVCPSRCEQCGCFSFLLRDSSRGRKAARARLAWCQHRSTSIGRDDFVDEASQYIPQCTSM